MTAGQINALAATTVFLLLGYVYVVLPPGSDYAGYFTDGIRYLVMAEHMAGGSQSSYGAYAVFHTSIFPPMYPLAIALVDADVAAAHKLTAVFWVAAAVPFWLWARRELSPLTALLLTVTIWLSPYLLVTSVALYSESLFLLFAFAALLVSTSTASRQVALALALLIALAVLTRTVGIALIPGFAIWLWRARLGRLPTTLAVVALVIPIAGWELFKFTTQTLPVHYVGGLSEKLTGAFDYWIATFIANVQALADVGAHSRHPHVAVLVGLVALPQLAVRAWRLKFDALFVVCYLGIIAIWPHPSHMVRFFLVPLPLIVFYAVLTLQRFSGRPVVPVVAMAVLLLIQAPDLKTLHERLRTDLPDELRRYAPSRLILEADSAADAYETADALHRLRVAVQSIPEHVEPGHCVYAVNPEYTFYWSRVQTTPMRKVADLTECRYALAVAISYSDVDFGPLYPATVPDLRHRPLFVSHNATGEAMATLLDLRPDGD